MDISSILQLRFEWMITLLILILIIVKLLDGDSKIRPFFTTINSLLAVNFFIGLLPIAEGSLFAGFFKTSHLIVLEKNILNLGLVLIALSSFKWMSQNKHRIEFYILILSSLLGMFTMLSSGHILTLYLGLEMSTIPLAAVANFDKYSKKASEAGVKLILSSAFSTGIMLFGISLLYGAVGNLSFDNISTHLQATPLTLFAFAFIVGGFAFKMSIVPFHLWTADVYEGSPIPVTNYLSVISKGSVIFVFVSVLYTLFGSLKESWLLIISIVSILSMTIGNLFALRQMNLKRLLAFSSISQVGFVLIGIAGASQAGMASSVYFVLIYIFSNIAAFGVIGAIYDATGREDLSAYKGLYKTNPFYTLIMALSLFSLAGIPPTAGFFGKLFLLTAGMSNGMYVLLGVAAINLVISLYNYLRVVKVMFMDEPEMEMPSLLTNTALSFALVVCVAGILAIGFVTPLYNYIFSLSY